MIRSEKNVIDIVNMSIEDTRRLNEIAGVYRSIYTDFVDDLSEKYGDEKYWWYTAFASRNTAVDDSFYECCCLKLILDRVREEEINEIILPSESLKKAVKKNISIADGNKNVVISILPKAVLERRGKNASIEKLKRTFFKNVSIRNAVNMVCSVASCRNIKKNYRNEFDDSTSRKAVTIVSAFAEASEFTDDGFKDRYFPGLKEYADSDILFFLSVAGDKREQGYIAGKLSEMDGYIPYKAYVAVRDYLSVMKFIRWSRNFRVTKCFFDGMEVSAIVGESISGCRSIETVISGILKTKALQRFIDKYQINPASVVEWYEGQPSSNILLVSRKKISKNAAFIAYEVSPLGENYLGQYPSRLQFDKGCCADYYTVQGEGWAERTRQFCCDISLVRAPSFRYKDAGRQMDNSIPKAPEDNLLIVLSYFVEDSRRMLSAVFKSKVSRKFNNVYIKNHPSNLNMDLRGYGIDDDMVMAVNCEFIGGQMSEALKLASNVLVGQTSSAVEILLGGANVVFFGLRGKLTNYFLPDGVPPIEAVYDERDIDEYFSENKTSLSLSARRQLKELSFVDVNKDTVRDFLNLKE